MRRLPRNYRFALRPAGGRKGIRHDKLVRRRAGSNRHHPVPWRGGKAT